MSTIKYYDDTTDTWKYASRGAQGPKGDKGDKGDAGDPATNLVQSVNGQTGVVTVNAVPAGGSNDQVLKIVSGDPAWAADTNTTYSEISEAEITIGTASTARTISGRRAQFIVDKANAAATVTHDTINEKTAGSGVTVDGVLLKDGGLDGVPIATTTGTQTLTNKRINPRIIAPYSTSTLTPNISLYDHFTLMGQVGNLTVAAPTGTPVTGNKILITIRDVGTPRTITWNAIYRPIGVTLPATTTANKLLYIGAVYNVDDTKWDVIAVSEES